jgi:chemotaxis protein histidine kinase CheA
MNNELVQQIEKIEKNLNNPNLPDSAKAKLKEKVEELKAKLKEAEKDIEKKEEKLEKEEKKVQSDVQDEIAKLEKNLNNPNLPDSVKEVMRKKIAAAKEKLAEQKQEIKEDKKEAAEEKKELKEAAKDVEKVAKEVEKVAKQEAKEEKEEKPKKAVRKPIKKAKTEIKKPKIKVKERAERSEKRKKEMRKIATELSDLIEKNKKLRKKYEGQGVDLDRDAGRSAKPFGYRFKGKKDYRVPTEAQIKRGLKRGTIDYEARPNRSDVYPKGYKGKIKLEEGGMMEDGGMMKKGGDVQGKVTDKAIDKQRYAKPKGWRWKDDALKVVGKVKMSKSPSKFMRAKYPDLVYWEGRDDKSDKNPSRRYQSI